MEKNEIQWNKAGASEKEASAFCAYLEAQIRPKGCDTPRKRHRNKKTFLSPLCGENSSLIGLEMDSSGLGETEKYGTIKKDFSERGRVDGRENISFH